MGTNRAHWGIAGLVVCAGVIGCGGNPTERQPSAMSVPSPDSGTAPKSPVRVVSFRDAITEDCPDDQLPPPDRTLNGLSTGKLREEVQRLWEQVSWTAPSGKKLIYTAVLDTEFGPVTLVLLPEIAPNHVRNFVALARVKYYDGLLFEHVIQQEGEGGHEARLEMVEAGCPLGTGEPGIGHLGYWLKPEFNAVKHEVGMVGACLTGEPDTAGCRFYITLSKAPVMDGNFTIFAKVTDGLDALRTITRQPRPVGALRPNRPAVIRSVTIQTREVD